SVRLHEVTSLRSTTAPPSAGSARLLPPQRQAEAVQLLAGGVLGSPQSTGHPCNRHVPTGQFSQLAKVAGGPCAALCCSLCHLYLPFACVEMCCAHLIKIPISAVSLKWIKQNIIWSPE